MKFSIGDLAVKKTNIQPYTSYNVLKVACILDGVPLLEHYGVCYDGDLHQEDYEFLPGSRGWRGAFERYQEEELYTLEEATTELNYLENRQSQLNQDFDVVSVQIQAKLDQAAALVGEASALAVPFDKDFYDLKSECMTLYYALNSGGWSHSHMSC